MDAWKLAIWESEAFLVESINFRVLGSNKAMGIVMTRLYTRIIKITFRLPLFQIKFRVVVILLKQPCEEEKNER